MNSFVTSMTQAIRESEVRMTALVSSEVGKCRSDVEAHFDQALKDAEIRINASLAAANDQCARRAGDLDERLTDEAFALQQAAETDCVAVEKRVTAALKAQRVASEQQVSALKTHIDSVISEASAASKSAFTAALQDSEAASAAKFSELETGSGRLEAKVGTLEKKLEARGGDLENKIGAVKKELETRADGMDEVIDGLEGDVGDMWDKVEDVEKDSRARSDDAEERVSALEKQQGTSSGNLEEKISVVEKELAVRSASVEERVSAVEKELEARTDSLEGKFDTMEVDLDTLSDRLEEKIGAMGKDLKSRSELSEQKLGALEAKHASLDTRARAIKKQLDEGVIHAGLTALSDTLDFQTKLDKKERAIDEQRRRVDGLQKELAAETSLRKEMLVVLTTLAMALTARGDRWARAMSVEDQQDLKARLEKFAGMHPFVRIHATQKAQWVGALLRGSETRK